MITEEQFKLEVTNLSLEVANFLESKNANPAAAAAALLDLAALIAVRLEMPQEVVMMGAMGAFEKATKGMCDVHGEKPKTPCEVVPITAARKTIH